VVSHPRNLIIAEEGSQATIIENYSGKKSDHPYFTNTVTKITAGTGAVLNHYKLQDEVETAFHLSSLEVEQKRDSSFSSYNLSLGALLARHEIQSNLLAEGADCLLNGLYMGHGRQHVDNQTYIDHIKPHCTSRELYKGILDDKAHGVFNGQILVRHGAQKTQSSLTNNNLLLSQEALIDTKPLLEIFADDVKCSHAATIGRLAEDQVFYCRSRGIDKELSRHLLTYAFASEILHGIKIQTLKTELEKIILNRLRIGELSVEATP
jgi:Fe-S cluster assembly protein SufD